jgi:transcriptional regulator with XRE-family HTH domain
MFMAEYRAFINAEKARTGMSWSYIAEQTKIAETTVRKIFSGETSNPSIESVESLKKLFGLPKDPGQREIAEQELQMVKLKNDSSTMGTAVKTLNEVYEAQIEALKANNEAVKTLYEARNAELKESLQKTIDAVTADRQAWQRVALATSAMLAVLLVIDWLMVFIG